MNTIGKTIKKLRLSRGMTQQQLADKVGARTYTTITKWESGANVPQGKDLILLSKLFNVSVDYILGIENKIKSSTKTSIYNYYPVSISAGLPIDVGCVTENDVEKISIPDSVMGKWAGSKDIFFTRVNGESMNKSLPHNSLIAVKHIELTQLKNGDIVVYSDNSDYSVKRVFEDLNNNRLIFRPHSTDTRFTDYIVNLEHAANIKIHGKVVLYIVEM